MQPQRVIRAADDVAFECELGGLGGGLGRGHVLAAGGRFGLGLDDVEWRQSAYFDARLVVGDQLVGQFDGAPGDVHGALREDEVPIGIPDVGQRLERDRLGTFFRNVAVKQVDLQLLPVIVDPEPAHEGLRVGGHQVRLEARIEGRERVRGLEARVGPVDRVAAAELAHVLRQAEVVRVRGVVDLRAAVQRAGGQGVLVARAERRRQVRRVEVANAGDLEVD